MCAVSVVLDYGRGVEKWTREGYNTFKDLLHKAGEFDRMNGEPNCENESKKDWMKELQKDFDRKFIIDYLNEYERIIKDSKSEYTS